MSEAGPSRARKSRESVRSQMGKPPAPSTAGEGKDLAGSRGNSAPDPEVLAKAERRKFSAEYKLRILEAADACMEPGEIGELLRREGLYSSHLSFWRRQREDGALSGLRPRHRGRKSRKDPLAEENKALRRKVNRLEQQLKKAGIIIEFQKKVAEILEIPLESPPEFEETE